MKVIAASGLALSMFAASLHAQENLAGTYPGTFRLQTNQGVFPIEITLLITDASEGKLRGKAIRGSRGGVGQSCSGEYKVEGTYKDNKIDLKAEPGGRAGDCPMRLRLVKEGNHLTGKMGRLDVEFWK